MEVDVTDMWANPPDFDAYFGALDFCLLRTKVDNNSAAPFKAEKRVTFLFES